MIQLNCVLYKRIYMFLNPIFKKRETAHIAATQSNSSVSHFWVAAHLLGNAVLDGFGGKVREARLRWSVQ